MSLVFLAMIGLVWPRIVELLVAVLGNPITELAVRPFMGVGDKEKMGRCGTRSRLDFLRRDGEDVQQSNHEAFPTLTAQRFLKGGRACHAAGFWNTL